MRVAAALLAACAAVALALVAPRAAHAYGTATTYLTSTGGTPPGAWSNVSAAASATDGGAAATLTESDAQGVAPVLQPADRDFASGAGGWSATDDSAALCTVTSAYTGAAGNPPGALGSTFSTSLALLGLVECTSTWQSASFSWSDGTPAAVAFSLDRNVDLGSGLQSSTADITVRLVDETVPGSLELASETTSSSLLGGGASGWGALTAASLTPSDIADGHTYHIEIETRFGSSVALVSGLTATYDNVVLSITPQNQRASGEATIAGVPPGTTHTLEVRGRTSGESWDLQVWDGATWTTRAGITGTADATVTWGLTAAEWNAGTVQIRFLDADTGVDANPDVLSLDFVRVVSTGGISVSGPTSVPLSNVEIDGLGARSASGTLADVEVVDGGGVASGWTLELTASRWTLDGQPSVMLPQDALQVSPGSPTAPDGDPLTGVTAGPLATVDDVTPTPLMSAGAGAGVGRYSQASDLELTVPVTALEGTYRSALQLTAS